MGLKIGLWNCIIYFEIVVDFDDWFLKLDAYNEKWKLGNEFWKLNRRFIKDEQFLLNEATKIKKYLQTSKDETKYLKQEKVEKFIEDMSNIDLEQFAEKIMKNGMEEL